jgi:pectin methylesterase-like acyl-CoA thioesterase
MKPFIYHSVWPVGRVMICLFAFAPIAQGVQTINVDMMSSGTVYSGTAAAPDSGTKWNSISAAGTLSTVYDSQTNVASGVAIAFASSGTVHIYNDTTTGNPNPSALMSGYTYGATYTLTVTGLAANQSYGLYAYSHGNVDNQTGTITLAAGNGGSSASTSQTGDSGNFRNIYMYGLGYNYVVLNGTADSSGTFTLTVVNYLNGLQLQRLAAPIIAGLTNQTVIAGTPAVLNPTLTGTPLPNLQWRSNSVAIAGQTNSPLTLNNVQYVQNNTIYSLVASNYVGKATNSMTLSVIVTPGITGLNNQAASTGTTLTIPATVAGVPTPSTRWQLGGNNLSDGATGNGSTISGSATSTLVINDAQAADSGTYSLIATNTAGIVTNSMTLTVSSGNVAPGITGPTDQTVVQSNNATFTASVSGLPVPTLQWRVNGAAISGQTNSSLTVTNVQFSQNGYFYSLVASNIAGMATNSATLFVLVPPVISVQPTNLSITVGSSASFSVTAGGVPAVSYQWNRNGTPIANAINPSFTVSNVQGSDNGAVFSVTVSNSVGNVTSSNSALTVLSTMTGTFLPTNGATNISPDQQLRITFSVVAPKLAYAGRKFYVFDASNNSLFTSIDTSQFQTYTVDGATVSNAFVRVEQGSYFYYMPIAVYGNQAWITLTNRFAYGHSYYVTCDTGLFLDSTGASFSGISGTNTWGFSTKSAGPATPTATTGPINLTVGLDGAGDFATLQGASDWVPQNNALHRTITIQPGTYHDNTCFLQGRSYVTVTGATTNRNDVQIMCPSASYASPSTGNGATLIVGSNNEDFRNFTLDNQVYLTNSLDNYAGAFAGRLLVLITTCDRMVFDNVIIKGGQDTYYATGSGYFHNCEIWGSVDFIYGSAVLVFDTCNIVEIRNTGGVCSAPNTAYAQPYGINFLNCTFPQALISNGYPYDVGTANTSFQRAWGQDGYTAVINCAIGNHISAAGWTSFGYGGENTCRAREYGTTLIGSGLVNVPQIRWNAGTYWLNTYDPDYTNSAMSPTDPLLAPPTGTNNRVAVTVNPATYTISTIFGNSYFTSLVGWTPATIPIIMEFPTNQEVGAGSTASFSVTVSGYPAPTYQWLKNSTNYPGATNATLTLTNAHAGDAATYSVVVTNSAGSMTSSNVTLTVANTAPVFTTVSDKTINAGVILNITNIVTDPDVPPQTLTFSLLTNPLTSTLNAAGVFNWRPSVNQAGTTNPVSVIVTDNGTPNLSATNKFNVIVNPVSKPALGIISYSGTQLSFAVDGGTVGPDYVVEVSTNLTGWQTLLTTNSPPQPFTFSEATTSGAAATFYRVRLSP